ncbi:MAG: FAD:protein FMN transferase [Bacteroidota bacterium]
MTRRNFLRKSSSLLPFVLLPAGFASGFSGQHNVRRTTYTMGTLVSIQAYGDDERLLHEAINKAFAEVRRLDALLSVYDPASEISVVNACAGERAVTVSPETIDVIQHAIRFSETTNSVFDCTVEPLMRLWGFRNPAEISLPPPSDTEVKTVLDAVGYRNISVAPAVRTVGLRKKYSAIDLGGIAVGYSVDRMAAILKNEGITSALINHSGDIAAIGAPPGTDGWSIGIPSIRNSAEIIHHLTLKDQAISTSGSTEKFRIFNGRHRNHIIDTLNGLPSECHQSVSVITQSSMTADVFSTALFLDEPRLPRNENSGTKLEYIFLDSNDSIRSHSIFL